MSLSLSLSLSQLVELDAKLNPHAPATVRLIVHQKAKPDLNERAVAAASVPVSLIPVFEHGANVTLPLPNSEDGESVSLHNDTPLELFRGGKKVMHIRASNENTDDDDNVDDEPSFFMSKILPGVSSAVSHISNVVISPLKPFISPNVHHKPTPLTPQRQKKARESSELDLVPQVRACEERKTGVGANIQTPPLRLT